MMPIISSHVDGNVSCLARLTGSLLNLNFYVIFHHIVFDHGLDFLILFSSGGVFIYSGNMPSRAGPS